MGDFIGGITDAVGLTDNEGEEEARRQAGIQADRSYALTKEQIAFQREQYDDWKNIYGDIQENLGNYYKELDGDTIESMGLQNQQREYQRVKMEMDKELIQKGISPDSGVAVAGSQNLAVQNSMARADIRTNAPQKAAEEKLKFLGVGLGQGTAMLGMVGNAYQSGAGNAANLSANNLNNATSLSMANMSSMQALAGTATGYAFGKPA